MGVRLAIMHRVRDLEFTIVFIVAANKTIRNAFRMWAFTHASVYDLLLNCTAWLHNSFLLRRILLPEGSGVAYQSMRAARVVPEQRKRKEKRR